MTTRTAYVGALLLMSLLVFTYAQEQSNHDLSDFENSLFGGAETETETPSLEDDLFGDDLFGDSDSIVSDIEKSDRSLSDELLTSETVSLGGSITMSTEATADINEEFRVGLEQLRGRLYLDARPSSDLRGFIKGDLLYDTQQGVSFELREMFVDTDLYDTVFLRLGKQTINWGVGRFFSPANLINLETINPEDPDAELIGPVAIKAQVPIGVNNLTGYLITESVTSGIPVIVAARYEFLVDNTEFTVGGLYQFGDNPWATMATVTHTLGEVDLFAEAVVQGNSDKLFLIEDSTAALGLGVESRADQLFVSGTLGGSYTYTTEEDDFSVSLTAQYFYNGLGYADTSLFTDNPSALNSLIATNTITAADLKERGQHYGAASVRINTLADTKLTPSLLWLTNLSDGSGSLRASLGYRGWDNISPSISYSVNYGASDTEYRQGPQHRISLSLDVAGAF